MLPYILMAGLPLGVKSFYKDLDADNRKKRNFLIIVGIFLFCFLALRNEGVGSVDTFNYTNMMRKAINADTWTAYYREDGVEKGFQLFIFGLSRVFRDPQWIIVVSSLINVVLVCYFIYKNSDDVALSVFMYITLGMMSFQMQGMRQAIAMSICLFAYDFAKQGKLVKFLLVVFLAVQFHQTAIAFLVVYILVRLKYNKKNIFLILFVGLAAILSAEKITTIANDLFGKHYNSNVESGGYVATLIHILIIAFALLMNSELEANSKATNMFYIAILGAVCYIMRYFGAQQSERISFYFMFAQLILLPNTLVNMKREESFVMKTIILMLTIALYIYRLNGSELVPYYFYWQFV